MPAASLASIVTLIHSDATGHKNPPRLIHAAQRCRLKPAAFAFQRSACSTLLPVKAALTFKAVGIEPVPTTGIAVVLERLNNRRLPLRDPSGQ
jgi:hypothetical protein